MRQISKIISVEERTSKAGNKFYLTTALLDFPEDHHFHDEEFSTATSTPPKVGDKTEHWFDDQYQKLRFKPKLYT